MTDLFVDKKQYSTKEKMADLSVYRKQYSTKEKMADLSVYRKQYSTNYLLYNNIKYTSLLLFSRLPISEFSGYDCMICCLPQYCCEIHYTAVTREQWNTNRLPYLF